MLEFPRANLPSAAVDPDSLARHVSDDDPHPGIYMKLKDNRLGYTYVTIFVTYSEFRAIPEGDGYKYNPMLVWYVGEDAVDPITGAEYHHMHPYMYAGEIASVGQVDYPVWIDKINSIILNYDYIRDLLLRHISDTDPDHPNFHPTLARKVHTHKASDIIDAGIIGSGNITVKGSAGSAIFNVNQQPSSTIDVNSLIGSASTSREGLVKIPKDSAIDSAINNYISEQSSFNINEVINVELFVKYLLKTVRTTATNLLPINTVILWAGQINQLSSGGTMEDWRLCNGYEYTLVKRDVVVGNQILNAKAAIASGIISEGEISESDILQITVPNTINRWVMGTDSSAGVQISAGLPGIAGLYGGQSDNDKPINKNPFVSRTIRYVDWVQDKYTRDSALFGPNGHAVYGKTERIDGTIVSSGSTMPANKNPYGKANTVTPPSVTAHYIIKLQDTEWEILHEVGPMTFYDVEFSPDLPASSVTSQLVGGYVDDSGFHNLEYVLFTLIPDENGNIPSHRGLSMDDHGVVTISNNGWTDGRVEWPVSCVPYLDAALTSKNLSYIPTSGTISFDILNKMKLVQSDVEFIGYSNGLGYGWINVNKVVDTDFGIIRASATTGFNKTGFISCIVSNLNLNNYKSDGQLTIDVGSMVAVGLPDELIINSSVASGDNAKITYGLSAKANTIQPGLYSGYLELNAYRCSQRTGTLILAIGPYFISAISSNIYIGNETRTYPVSELFQATNMSAVKVLSVVDGAGILTKVDSNTLRLSTDTTVFGQYTCKVKVSATNCGSSTCNLSVYVGDNDNPIDVADETGMNFVISSATTASINYTNAGTDPVVFTEVESTIDEGEDSQMHVSVSADGTVTGSANFATVVSMGEVILTAGDYTASTVLTVTFREE